MSKKWFGALALALALVWGTTAMAQMVTPSPYCEGMTKVLHFPFFTSTADQYWNGVAISNTSGVRIPAANVCILAYATDTEGRVSRVRARLNEPQLLGLDGGIPGQGMFVSMVEDLGSAAGWEQTLHMGVYASNSLSTEQIAGLRGFGMIGSTAGQGGQGYNAVNLLNDLNTTVPRGQPDGLPENALDGTNYARFTYTPGDNGGWWTGIGIANNSAGDIRIQFTLYSQDGIVNGWTSQQITIPQNGVWKGLLEDLDGYPGGQKRMQVEVTAEPAPGPDGVPSNQPIRFHAFGFFSDDTMANGMIPEYGVRQ